MVNIFNGTFTADGSSKTLVIRGNLDSIEVWNATEAAAANASHGVSYYWQKGLASNNGFITMRNAAATAINSTTSAALAVSGFTLVDSSVTTPGAAVATTDIGTVAHRVLTATTAGLSAGSIVRLSNMTSAHEFDGMDYTVTAVNAGVSFDIAYTPVTVAAAAAGQYRIIPHDTLYYPRNRFIASISQATQAVVVLTVTHNLQIGQAIRFHVDSMYGMTEIDGLMGNIVDIDTATNSITVDIDTTGFTAFAWPLTAVAAASAHTLPQIAPIGEDTPVALAATPPADILTDAVVNTGYTGIILGAGVTSPAGSANDVIYWRATSSFEL
jgi:hypothetical protein